MKKFLFLLAICFTLIQCNDEDQSSCSVYATIRDLTGFDGCRFVLELEDGSFLEPIRPVLFCGTPPVPKEISEDPLYNFEFVNGKRVKISYEETGNMSICMVGPVVKITCIREVSVHKPEED